MLKRLGLLLACIAFPLLVGGLSSVLNMESAAVYNSLKTPPLSPPSVVFPAVWSVLYGIMGWVLYLLITNSAGNGLWWKLMYGGTLLLNFVWQFVFFKFKMFFFAFIIILAMWTLAVFMIITFRKIKPLAAYLLIPYAVWITFAGYLCFGVALFN